MVLLILIYLPAFSPVTKSTFWVTVRNCLKCVTVYILITGNFFAYRTVNIWNLLDNEVVMSRNSNIFEHV